MASSGLPGSIGRAVLRHFPIWPCSVWGLPCPAPLLVQAVSSYLTVSPLPDRLKPARRSILCGTFRRLTTPGRYPAHCSAEFGLSSSQRPATVHPSSHANYSTRNGAQHPTPGNSGFLFRWLPLAAIRLSLCISPHIQDAPAQFQLLCATE